MSKQLTFRSENKTNLFLPFLSSFAGMLAAIPISMVVSSTIVNAGLERQLAHLQPATSQAAPLVSQTSSCVAPAEETTTDTPKVEQTAVLGTSTGGHVLGTSHKKHFGHNGINHSFNNTYQSTTNNTYTKTVNVNSNNVVDSYNYDKEVTKVDTTINNVDVKIKDSFNKDSYNNDVKLNHEETNVTVVKTNINSNNEVNNTTNNDIKNVVNSNNETNVNSKNDVEVKVEDSFNPVVL